MPSSLTPTMRSILEQLRELGKESQDGGVHYSKIGPKGSSTPTMLSTMVGYGKVKRLGGGRYKVVEADAAQ